jgi:hypothetical protein
VHALIAVAAILLQQAAPDSAAVRAAARRAEAAYERDARRYAPLTGWSGSGARCDEIVGRFCLRFDDGAAADPPPEPARIVDARRAAIDALRRAVAMLPGDAALVGPLVRLLIEDDRAGEAVAAARTLEALAPDSAAHALLVGLALHAAGEEAAAAERFTRALVLMDEAARARAHALDWLVAPAERRRYRALPADERARYAQAVWTLADPLYLTRINERWAEHIARYAYARLLERVPLVHGMHRWGRDLEELLIRYGVAYRRGRELGPRLDQAGIVEYYDPRQLAYVPETLLSRGYPPPPLPGMDWPLAAERARSGYAPRSIRSMEPLPHQLTRIPAGAGWLVRVDATFGLDSMARVPPPPLPGDTASANAPVPDVVATGLFLLATGRAMDRVAAAPGTVSLEGDSARLTLATIADSGAYVYSAEAYEPATRTARRARYTLELPAVSGLRVSDVLVARPFGNEPPHTHTDRERLRPLAHLVIAPNATIGIYAEVAGLRRGAYDVEVLARRADRGSLPARLVRWLGASLGVARAPAPPRVRWRATHDSAEPLVIALDLPLTGLGSGLHVIEIAVIDSRTGQRAAGQRVIRIE